MYAVFLQSTNPPAAPPPTQPVVNADIQQSTNPPAAPSPPTQPVVYTDIHQSTNPPAAPPLTQPVVYAEVKQSTNPPAAPSSPTQPKPIHCADLCHTDIHQHALDVHMSTSASHDDPADDTHLVQVITII